MNPAQDQKSDPNVPLEHPAPDDAGEPTNGRVFTHDSPLVKATFRYSVLVLAVIVAAFHLFQNSILGRVTADLRVALPLLQIAYGLWTFRQFGLPRSYREWAVVIFLHAFLIWNYWMLHRNLHGIAVTYFLEFLLRLGILGGWAVVTVGTFVLLHVMVKGRRRHRLAGRALKITFATAVILLPLEYVSSAIEARRNAPLPLTVDLPAKSEVHIATIGGSTMRGFPYDLQYGIGRVVQWQLQRIYPDQRFVLDNVAVTGINLEQAIARINEASGFPDILIVYSGHNEFFHDTEGLALARRTHWPLVDDFARKSSLFRTLHRYLAQHAALPMPGLEEATVCGSPLCPDYVMRERVEAYTEHLRRLFEWAEKNGVHVVFCVPASGDTNLAPNVSAADSNSKDNIAKQWVRIRDLQQKKAISESIDAARQAVAAYPRFAEFHFLLGMSLRDIGEHQEAREHFVLAKDLDQLPLRCLTAWQDAGIRAAKEYAVPVVHSEEILRKLSSDGILDEKLFLDGVHPNLRATFALAENVTRAIVTNQFAGTKMAVDNTGTFSESLLALSIDANTLADAYSQTSDVWSHYAHFRAFARDNRELQAKVWAQRAARLRSGEISPGEDGTEALELGP